MKSHTMCRTCSSQYQASSGTISSGDGRTDCHLGLRKSASQPARRVADHISLCLRVCLNYQVIWLAHFFIILRSNEGWRGCSVI